MTLESRNNINRYVGNGAAAEFPFTFRVWKKDQVQVFVGDGTADQDVSAQCAVALTASGGTVTFPAPPPAGQLIALRRKMPYIQEDDYRNGTRFDSEEIEDRFDQDCAERQDLRLDVDRALKVPATSTQTPEEYAASLIAAHDEALEAADNVQAWLAEVGTEVGDHSYVTAAGSTVARTLSERFEDVVNVRDHGAAGDGVTDDAAAIQAAARRCAALGRAILFFPQGSYFMSYSCALPGNLFVEAGGATFIRPGTGTRSSGFFNNSLGIPIGDEHDGEGVNGYEGNSNIYFHGGIFQGNGQTNTSRQFQFMSYGHARNITIDGCIFFNHCGSSHVLELAGVENVVVRNCSFIGWNPIYYNVTTGEMDDASNATREAIQLECLVVEGNWMPNFDFTPTRFVTIQSCFFGPNPETGLTAHSVAIGGHQGAKLISGEAQVHDVTIVDCTFHGMIYSCLRMTAFSGVVFSGNKCYNCHSMVSFTGRTAADVNPQNGQTQTIGIACSNIIISNNLFYDKITESSDAWMAIHTTNSLSEESNPAYHENVVITGNSFYRPGRSLTARDYCIYLDGFKQLTINNNTFRYHTNNVIQILGKSISISITNSDIRQFDSYGIAIRGTGPTTNYQTNYYLSTVFIENNRIFGDWVSDNYMAHGIHVKHVKNFKVIGNNVYTFITLSNSSNDEPPEVPAILIEDYSSSGYVANNTVTTNNTRSDVYDITISADSESVACGDNLIKTTTGGGSYRTNIGTVTFTPTRGPCQVLRATGAQFGTLYRNIGSSLPPAVAGSWSAAAGGALTFGFANPNNSASSTLLMLYDRGTESDNPIEPTLAPVAFGTVTLGTGNLPFAGVYANAGSIDLSDGRYKLNVESVEQDALMRAWSKVNYKIFQFAQAIEKKGQAEARLHVGIIAQEIADAFTSEGLDASRYGLFCYDSWDERYEDDVKVQDAGDRYGIRYSEALALECAYQRWRIAQIEERVDQLTAQQNN